jgi:hypothetical protein
MMDAARTSETSVDNYFTRQYIPEDLKCVICYSSYVPDLELTSFENTNPFLLR